MLVPEERRKFARLNTLTDITYNRKHPLDERRLTLSKNISKGGICFIAYEELEEREVLDLNIYLPEDKKPIRVSGRVAWVKEFIIGDQPKNRRFDVGIEFIGIGDEDKNKIDKYIFILP